VFTEVVSLIDDGSNILFAAEKDATPGGTQQQSRQSAFSNRPRPLGTADTRPIADALPIAIHASCGSMQQIFTLGL
jgi:hypothetical protein